MGVGEGEPVPGRRAGRRRWTSFIADAVAGGRAVHVLHDETNPKHRLRVEHDAATLLVHLSGEDGDGWTTLAVDRATRRWAVAQEARQSEAARRAYEALYSPDPVPAAPVRRPGSRARMGG